MTSGGLSDWAAYYQKTRNCPPRPTAIFALDRFDAEAGNATRLVVDLGAGGGRDAIAFLQRGWQVIAIDGDAAAADALWARRDIPDNTLLKTQTVRFEDARWPRCNLVNASFALPLCAPDQFDTVWERIMMSLLPGGRFAGQFYGERDSWAGRSGMTFQARSDIERLFSGFEIEYFEEEEDDSETPRGETKHWHVFHVVARLRAD